MTCMSNFLALALMPLNMWLYTQSWVDENLTIPYKNIVLTLAMTLTPAAIGIIVRRKWIKVASFGMIVRLFCCFYFVVKECYNFKLI